MTEENCKCGHTFTDHSSGICIVKGCECLEYTPGNNTELINGIFARLHHAVEETSADHNYEALVKAIKDLQDEVFEA